MTESELLTLLLEKPALYIEYESIVKVKAFIDGYTFARQSVADPIYLGFGKWLQNRFEINLDLNWVSIICFVGRSETGAFDLAKRMWQEYKQEHE